METDHPITKRNPASRVENLSCHQDELLELLELLDELSQNGCL